MPGVVKELYAFIPGDPIVLTASGHYDTPFFFSEILRYRDYDERFWETAFTRGGLRIVLPETTVTDHGQTLGVLPVVTTARISGNTVVHVADLDARVLQQLFVDGTMGRSSRFAILADDGVPLYRSEPDGPDAASLAAYAALQPGTLADGSFVFPFRGGDSGWTYLALVPEEEVARAASTGALFWVILLSMLLGAVLVALLMALNLYRPIGKVSRMIPRREGESLDELSHLREGIGRLLDERDTYDESYARHSLHLLLLGLDAEDPEALGKVMRGRYGFHGERLICLLFLFDCKPSFYAKLDKGRQRLFFSKLPQVIRTQMAQAAPSMAFDLHGGMFACVCGADPFTRPKVVERARQCRDLFAGDRDAYSLHIGVGNSVADPGHLSASYNQALAAVRACPKDSPFAVVEFGSIQQRDEVSFDFYDQKALRQALVSGSTVTLGRLLDGIFSRNDFSSLSPENQKELVRQLMLVGSQLVEGKDLASRTSLQAWLDHPEGSCEELVRSFFLEVQEAAGNPVQEGADALLARQAEAYITRHYPEPLSLEIVSGALGVSAKYLSRVYKDRTGENLSVSISRIRMERAKVLLRDGSLKVGDVAKAVGMDSRATFLRVFRKMIGVSPTEYRALVAQEGK